MAQGHPAGVVSEPHLLTPGPVNMPLPLLSQAWETGWSQWWGGRRVRGRSVMESPAMWASHRAPKEWRQKGGLSAAGVDFGTQFSHL